LGAARYRPPALRTITSSPPDDLSSNPAPGDAPNLPASNYPPGFKRARAGTLPNVHLASSQRPANATNATSTEAFPEQPQRQTAVSITPNLPPASASTSRPNLRHTTSVASSVSSSVAAERNSRLRSGSLTLPAAGLSNAFGPSIFSSSWLSSNNTSGNGYPVLDELRSVTSADSGADDFDVHTLDYLGLDDTHHRPPPAATISELRHQAQAAVTGNLVPSRMRASTVSNPYHLRPSVPNPLLSPSNTEEEEAYFDGYDEQAGITYGQQPLSAFEGSDGSYLTSPFMPKGFNPTDHLGNSGVGSRPRAISVGVLDDPMRSLQRRSASSELLLGDASAQNQNLVGIGGPTGILKTDKSNLNRNGSSSSVHFPNGDHRSSYLAAPNPNNRAVSPKSDTNNNSNGTNTQTQTPTRSLWIGNLDSSFTSEQLIHVFAHYGAIESLRLLPEKVRH
jgi:protein JSN1